MPKTQKQKDRARRRRRGELVVAPVTTNVGRRQMTHFKQSREADMERWTQEAARKSPKRKR